MGKKEKSSCTIEISKDPDTGRPIFEFSEDSEACREVVSALTGKEEIIIRAPPSVYEAVIKKKKD